jgi:hypothetical protein
MEVKVVPVYTMKAYGGIGSINTLFLNLDTRWRRVVSFTFRPLFPSNKDWLAGWVSPRTGLDSGKDKNRAMILGRSVRNLVTILSNDSQRQYTVMCCIVMVQRMLVDDKEARWWIYPYSGIWRRVYRLVSTNIWPWRWWQLRCLDTLILIYQYTRRNIPEDRNLHNSYSSFSLQSNIFAGWT